MTSAADLEPYIHDHEGRIDFLEQAASQLIYITQALVGRLTDGADKDQLLEHVREARALVGLG